LYDDSKSGPKEILASFSRLIIKSENKMLEVFYKAAYVNENSIQMMKRIMAVKKLNDEQFHNLKEIAIFVCYILSIEVETFLKKYKDVLVENGQIKN
jgi:hypothetical protein